MAGGSSEKHKPRELRRRVVVSARLQHASRWSDASILNISSRGLLIHTSHPLEQGSRVEVRRGRYAINARVVWREGAKAGLQAEHRVPVEALASGDIGQPVPALRPERRRRPRTHDESRRAGRSFEFAGLIGVSALFAIGILAMVGQALAHPLALVTTVLR